MSKVIAIDCDEVLADSMRSILTYHNNMCCGYPIQREHITNYHLGEMDEIGVTNEETIPWFNNFMLEHHDKVIPVSGAYEKMSERKELGYRLMVVTARSEDDIGDVTKNWMQNHFEGLVDDVLFTNHFTGKQVCKGDICQHISADVFIDDNPFHAMAVAQYGTPTYLLEKPRNHSYTPDDTLPITKIAAWDEIHVE